MEMAKIRGQRHDFPKMLLHHIFDSVAREKPEEVAIFTVKDTFEIEYSMTFAYLNKRTDNIARCMLEIIQENNLKPYEFIVGVSMKNQINLLAVLLATWKIGAAYMPFETSYPEEFIENMLEETSPLLMIYEGDFDWQLYTRRTPTTIFMKFIDLLEESDYFEEETSKIEPLDKKDDNPIAFVIYISDASDFPKGVRINHHTAHNFCQWRWKKFPFNDSEENCLFKSPMTSITHFSEIFPALLAGRTIVTMKDLEENIENLSKVVEKFKVQRLNVYPKFLNKILEQISESGENKFQNVKLWINSGDILPMHLAEEFFDCFNKGNYCLVNTFGAVETMWETLYFIINSKDQLEDLSEIPLGFPTYNTNVYIMNETKKIMDKGEIGDINIAGVTVCYGFCDHRDEEKIFFNTTTANPKFWRLFGTGDLGRIVDGIVYYEGRKDMQIKSNGYQVEVAEIENVFNNLRCFEKSLVCVYNRGGVHQTVLAFIVLRKGQMDITTLVDVRNEVQKKLPDYLIPEIQIIPHFPLSPSGKINVEELFRIYEIKSMKKPVEYEVQMDLKDFKPEDVEKAKKVLEIIGRTIKPQKGVVMTATSNFFEIGGNSLNTILCIDKLRQKNFDISLDDFLKAKNLRELIKYVENRQPGRTSRLSFEIDNKLKLYATPLDMKSQEKCMRILVASLCEREEIKKFVGSLDQQIIRDFLEPLWEFFVERQLSFMVMNENDKPVGVSLNVEVGDEPKKEELRNSPLEPLLEFVGHSMDNFITKNSSKCILKTFIAGIATNLSPSENIQVANIIERNILSLIRHHSMDAVISTDISQLSQQLHEHVLGYKVIEETQINRYTDKTGNRPFKNAKDALKTKTMLKLINE